MKNNSIFAAIASLLVWTLASCTSTTRIQVLQPAEMKIPDHIERIATVDRAKPSKGFNNVVEGLFTGEGIGTDRRGRQAAISGVSQTLTKTPRFEVKSTGIELTGSKSGSRIEPPLPWSEIENLCQQYDVDAILTLEQFDSDQSNYTSEGVEKYKVDGVEKTRPIFTTNLQMNVESTWRLYDPKNRVVLDEWLARADEGYNSSGRTRDQSVRGLPSYDRIVSDLGYEAGTVYGMRIAPVWVYVERTFFTKGKKDFKEDMQRAARYAKGNDWDRAAEIWNALTTNADRKTAGKSAHNLAVAAERAGKLDIALDWAKRAYTEYGNKSSREYIRALEFRIADAERVDYQMDTEDKP